MQERKVCTKCNEEKPLTKEYFTYAKKRNKYTYRSDCKACEKKYRQQKALEAKIIKLKEKAARTEKKCSSCKRLKRLNTDNFRLRGIKVIESVELPNWNCQCRECEHEYHKKYYKANPDKIKKKSKRNWKKLKNKLKNPEFRKQYREDRRKIERRLKNDSSFKLRTTVSRHINNALKKNDSSKAGESCLKHLPYSINELKNHIESQFEWWMSWDNWGIYKVNEWDDNDFSTWKWNIDHIIPQCKLPYNSMTDPNFKKCWALDNLRPLSAKKNVQNGCRNRRNK